MGSVCAYCILYNCCVWLDACSTERVDTTIVDSSFIDGIVRKVAMMVALHGARIDTTIH